MGDSQISVMVDGICDCLDRVRERNPLIHNITNYVVMNFTANVLLALGASPVMAHAPEEMEEMVGLANALVINIGTLSTPWVESMFLAVKAAQRRAIPIVLDPVGVGATRFRTETARALIAEAQVAIIRGNASEILALSGHAVRSKGVDSVHATEEASLAAAALAKEQGAVVAVTGVEDYITNGVRSVGVRNGHSLLGKVTGTGCAATSIMGAFAAVESDVFIAATGALVAFGIAGELAARSRPGPGTFQTLLLDELDALTRTAVRKHARVKGLSCVDENA